MNKPFYEEYANHAFRFYVRYPVLCKNALKKADHEMWRACDTVYKALPERDQAVITTFYRFRGPRQDAVLRISAEQNINENQVWQVLHRAARSFAEIRGLV